MERVFSSITLLIFVFFPCLTIFFATITEALETKSDEKTEARKMYDDVYNAGINISNEMRIAMENLWATPEVKVQYFQFLF